jgi:hypothetical protein
MQNQIEQDTSRSEKEKMKARRAWDRFFKNAEKHGGAAKVLIFISSADVTRLRALYDAGKIGEFTPDIMIGCGATMEIYTQHQSLLMSAALQKEAA